VRIVLPGLASLLATCVAAPAVAVPRRSPSRVAAPARAAPRPPAAPEPAAAPAEEFPVLSRGEEVILVDRLRPEGPTIVLFYRPDVDEDRALLEAIQRRVRQDPRVALRLVQLPGLEAPVARQYEVGSTPTAFVYDRNKNLVGKGGTLAELGPHVGRALRLARLKWVNESDPEAAEVYRAFGGGARPVPEIMKTMSLLPGAMELMNEIAGRYHFRDGFLTRRTKEMIASYVSALNKCKY
jgi:alkylhydroperoxidase/carboxymuconolactone decarboxylase family protein YurZ